MVSKTLVSTDELSLDDALNNLKTICEIYDEITGKCDINALPKTKNLVLYGIEDSLDNVYKILGLEKK